MTVTINDPTDNSDVTTEPSTLTFNASNYGTGQNVTVSAAGDADTADDVATIDVHSGAVGRSNPSTTWSRYPVVTVKVTDPDIESLLNFLQRQLVA